ncbi:MAG: hypothetical protein BWY71_00546 [Planctomycetes bacterium ADurb.Bin412]|nr:MAG: hypothetical protein BWY71_00546 [Planctomycetes bacterium ADurb.Bin412]
MWRAIAVSLFLFSWSGGCLFVYNGDKVVRKNEPKRQVQFESAEASQLFHNKFNASLCSCQNRDEEHESVVIPFIMATNTSTKLSESACYNDALTLCDNNKDNCISLAEAQTYAGM